MAKMTCEESLEFLIIASDSIFNIIEKGLKGKCFGCTLRILRGKGELRIDISDFDAWIGLDWIGLDWIGKKE